MQNIANDAPGAFCWAGLATSDPEDARRFYTSLFGWQSEDVPAGAMGVCTLLRRGHLNVALLYEQTREARQAGAPPHWTTFVSTPDADATIERARSLGATVLREPFDVLGLGRVAALRDPAGAIISVWQRLAGAEAARVSQPGSRAWNELATTELERARSFYAELFSWTYETSSAGDDITIVNGGGPIGRIRERRHTERGLPSAWLPYFTVDSAEETTWRARQLEGISFDRASLSRWALLADRQGATFAVVEAEAAGP